MANTQDFEDLVRESPVRSAIYRPSSEQKELMNLTLFVGEDGVEVLFGILSVFSSKVFSQLKGTTGTATYVQDGTKSEFFNIRPKYPSSHPV